MTTIPEARPQTLRCPNGTPSDSGMIPSRHEKRFSFERVVVGITGTLTFEDWTRREASTEWKQVSLVEWKRGQAKGIRGSVETWTAAYRRARGRRNHVGRHSSVWTANGVSVIKGQQGVSPQRSGNSIATRRPVYVDRTVPCIGHSSRSDPLRHTALLPPNVINEGQMALWRS